MSARIHLRPGAALGALHRLVRPVLLALLVVLLPLGVGGVARAQAPEGEASPTVTPGDAPSGPAEVLTGAGRAPHPGPVTGPAPPSHQNLGMQQLSGRPLPLAVARPSAEVPAGTIRVHVRDFRNAPVAGARIRVGVMNRDQSRESHEATTDANGDAMFTNLPDGEAQAYRVNLQHEGAVTSTPPFRLEPGRGQRAEVMQLPVVTDARLLAAWTFMTSMEFRESKLHVVHQVELVNLGDAIIAFPEEGLRFAVPAAAEGFQSQPVMTDQRVVPGEGEFRLMGSIEPGAVRLLYGYDVPLDPGTLALEVGVPMRVRTVQVVLQKAPGVSLAVSDMPEAVEHDVPQPAFVVQSQRDGSAPPLSSMMITVSGIPGPGPLRYVAVAFAFVLALAGVLMVLDRRDPEEAEQRARDVKRDELLTRIAALEIEREAGDVGPEYYARTRDELRDELALLAKQAGLAPVESTPS